MEKPKPIVKIIEYLDYFECCDYIIWANNDISDRNMKKFWTYLCEYNSVNNGSFFWIDFDYKPSDENIAIIWEAFKIEFAPNGGSIKFMASW